MSIFRIGSKKTLSILLVLMLVIGLMPLTAFAAKSQPFEDTVGHWAEQSINRVVEEGLFKGISETAFDPQGSMTRAMFITVLHRLAEKVEGPKIEVKQQQFTDVPANAWYADALDWAVSAGLTEGYGQGIFAPNDLLNREQITVLLIRFLEQYLDIKLEESDAAVEVFADDAQISSWAKEAVYKAVSLGLIKGEAGNVFNGKGVATRAVVAVISERFLDEAENLLQSEPENTPSPSPTPEATPAPSADPSSPGTGSGGGSDSTKTNIKSAILLLNGEEIADREILSGDELTVSVQPKGATYSVKWLVNGVEKPANAEDPLTYTVSPLDGGGTIVAEVTGTGRYQGTVKTTPTSKVLATVNLAEQDIEKSPVVVDPSATYLDNDGNEINLTGEEIITFNVTAVEEELPAEEKAAAVDKLIDELKIDLDELAEEKVELDVKYIAIDASLTVEREDGDNSVIHPVGNTTLNLSKANLGIAEDEDISNYIFIISHTNKEEVSENVLGEVVEINGEQFVRVTLNGLSVVFIGNIPPLTVSFDTVGGSEIADKKVKFGEVIPDFEVPTKEGHFFIGWNADLANTKIYRDVTFTAQWLEGGYVSSDRITLVDQNLNAIEDITVSSTSQVRVELIESGEYDAHMVYTLLVDAPEGAVKYAVETVAETAALAKFEDATVFDELVELTVNVTDEEGKVITGSYPFFIKWFNEEGEALNLEAVSVVIETDQTTATREKTFNINRGVGKVEAYLTAKETEDVDYVAYINGHLSGSPSQDNYRLELNASFNEYMYLDTHDGRVDFSKYDGFRLELTPFEGESYEGKNINVEAYYYNQSRQTIKVSTELDDAGDLIITNAPDVDIHKLGNNSRSLYLYFNVKVGGQTQYINLNLHGIGDIQEETEKEHIYTNEWSEVVSALAEHENVYVHYNGDAVIDHKLELGEYQHLYINGDVTISENGELVLGAVTGNASYIHVTGDMVINGKVTTVSQNENAGTYYYTGLYVQGLLTVASGGEINTPGYGLISLDGIAGVIVEEDGLITNNGSLMMDSDDVLTIYGEVNNIGRGTSSYYLNGELRIYSDVELHNNITVSQNSHITINGLLTIAEAGSFVIESGHAQVYGKFYNEGSIHIVDGTMTLSNVGYAVNNYGTIELSSKAQLILPGTKLVHTGEITGKGTISLQESANVAGNYDNGLAYVEAEGVTTLNNYSRYQFVKDPEETATAKIYVSEISGDGSVEDTVKVNTVKIPE